MEYRHIKYTCEQRIAYITLDRPDKANSLHADAWKELSHALHRCSKDHSVQALFLAGSGQHFCAGLDREYLMYIATLQDHDGVSRSTGLRQEISQMQDCIYQITTLPIPVVACIHGACIGAGLEIVSACDMRICSEDALFSLPEITMGITPDLGALQYLPRIISQSLVMDLALSGKRVSAAEALTAGLVSRISGDHKELTIESGALASQLSSYERGALMGVKASLHFSSTASIREGLDHVLDLTVKHLSQR